MIQLKWNSNYLKLLKIYVYVIHVRTDEQKNLGNLKNILIIHSYLKSIIKIHIVFIETYMLVNN